MVQKSQKWPKTQIKGCPALNWWRVLHFSLPKMLKLAKSFALFLAKNLHLSFCPTFFPPTFPRGNMTFFAFSLVFMLKMTYNFTNFMVGKYYKGNNERTKNKEIFTRTWVWGLARTLRTHTLSTRPHTQVLVNISLLKIIPKYPFVGGKHSVFCFRHYYFHKVSKKTTKSFFAWQGKG